MSKASKWIFFLLTAAILVYFGPGLFGVIYGIFHMS